MSHPANALGESVGLLLGYDLSFCSYFVRGFQELGETTGISLSLTSPRQHRDFAPLTSRVGPGYAPSILLVRYSTAGKSLFAAIDIADSSDAAFQYSYRRDVLPFVDVYFKVNLDRGSLNGDAFLRQYDHKIVDLPFFFAVRPRATLGLLAAASARNGFAASARSVVDTLWSLRTMMPLAYFDTLRRQQKTRDFSFLVTYYSHPDHKNDNEFRLELIRKLREDSALSGIAAFAANASLPAPYSAYTTDFVPLKALLRMYASSRVAVYVRGLHDCLSFKLGQYLALGMPIAGQEIFLDNHFARSIPNFEAQFGCTSADDIVRSLKALLNDPSESAAEIGRRNLEYFTSCVSPIKTAEYVVATMRSRLDL